MSRGGLGRVVVLAGALAAAGCGAAAAPPSGSGAPSGSAPFRPQAKPADPAASADTAAVLAYLAGLSSGALPGVVVGQNVGHGVEILAPSGLVGYAPLVDALERRTGRVPGIVGLDYEHDRIYTPAELAAANELLIEHWRRGGLVAVTWSPHDPWRNHETDLRRHPGVHTDVLAPAAGAAPADLRELLDPRHPVHAVWRRKLDRVADALQGLQAAGVVVLWRPMQEMNGYWFWWGGATTADGGAYAAVWRDMFHYFTGVKGLHNLLWVYSPNPGPALLQPPGVTQPVGWAYPGDAYVDVVAGTRYHDTLAIDNYVEYLSFGKVLGMGEYGSSLAGPHARNGTFDNTLYLDRLTRSYPAIAYWVCWHDWGNGDGTFEHHALASNRNAAALLENPQALSLDRLAWRAPR
jgi:mannan endo-1,4-beta-mannosidase